LSAVNHRPIVEQIFASGRQLVIAVTGGGSGAISALVQTPGASRAVLEAVVPYSLAALVDWLAGQPDQACSEATARAMAMAAFMRARHLAPDADPASLVGVGFTGSLATDRPKRGERRIHLAAQSAKQTEVLSISLGDDQPSRASDEAACTATLLWLIARACDAGAGDLPQRETDQCRQRVETAPPEWTELLLGRRQMALITPESTTTHMSPAPPLPVVFPGAFNPPHAGHLRMAEIAEHRLGPPVAWELSITNVDKPPLDFIAVRDRIDALREADARRPIVLTTAPTFLEKAELFPGAAFIVGADTLARIAQPRYYNDDPAKRDAAVADIAQRGCRFLVFGRELEGRFQSLEDLPLPAALRATCDEVPATKFREDVTSTELRAQLAPGL
jgi:nicotinic acid mononucleotide adenylyltransferase/nicotinamide mononucleotide (NMN) deamidase PncC